MKLAIIGTGYVGLGVGACLADLGHNVTCVDVDRAKIAKLKKGIPTIYEEHLPEMLKKNLAAGRINFTASLPDGIRDAAVVFIAVGTPQDKNGKADLKYVLQVARDLGKNLKDYKVIVDKSTVPIGTGKLVREEIEKNYQGEFDVVSNPEFQREGTAINDFLYPDRIVLGFENPESPAIKIMREVYAQFKAPIVITNLESAEMIKYAANSFLAVKISFINEIANIADNYEADVKMVARGMGLDSRIGDKFLEPGPGYGGSCFPKDVAALYHFASSGGYWFNLLEAVMKINKHQREIVVAKIKNILGGRLKDKKIAVLGLAFKPNTDDIRESPAIDIINLLLKRGVKIKAYDPIAAENARKALGKKITFANDPYRCLTGADVLLIATDWPEFKKLNLTKIKKLLKTPKIVDARNMFEPDEIKAKGFEYVGIGR